MKERTDSFSNSEIPKSWKERCDLRVIVSEAGRIVAVKKGGLMTGDPLEGIFKDPEFRDYSDPRFFGRAVRDVQGSG